MEYLMYFELFLKQEVHGFFHQHKIPKNNQFSNESLFNLILTLINVKANAFDLI